jgi:iron complex outermembrane recepter protein
MIISYPHAFRKVSAGRAAWLLCAVGATVHLAPARAADSSTQQAAPALNEIIVTAQKVSQRAQDVPLTLTAVSASALAKANITTMYDLPTLVSGLVWANEGAWATPSIRGISTTDVSIGAPSPVAIYVDGVYQPDSGGTLLDLPDVSSIQVLKGPQGTLYGQNAVAGAIVVNTLDPTFTPTGNVDVTGGMFGGDTSRDSGHYSASAFVSGPLIGNTLAGSISGYYNYIDGYLTNDLNGQRAGRVDGQNVRGKLLWTPADGVKILATAFYTHREDGVTQANLAYGGITAASFYPGSVIATEPWHIAYTQYAPNVASDMRGAILKATFDLGLGTLTSTSSYTDNGVLVGGSTGGAYSPACIAAFSCVDYQISEPEDTWAQAVDFASRRIGNLEFLAGVYGFSDDAHAYIGYNSFAFITDTNIRTVSYAAYGEATYHFTDKLSLVGGVRVTHDQIKATGYVGLPPDLPYADKGWTAATPRVSLVYRVNPIVNTYLTFNEGFKGGVASGEYATTPPANPEKLYSYELGVKAARSRYMADVSAFYYDYKDLQVETDIDQGAVTLEQNAATAKLYGFDLDGAYRWTDAFESRLSAEYLARAEYSSFPTAVAFVPPLGPYGLATDYSYDASSTRLLDAPLWTGTLSGTYTQDFTAGVLQATGSVYWASGYRWTYTGSIQTPGYYLLNAQLVFSPSSSNFRYTLYGKNLANKAYIDGATPIAVSAQAFYGAPREIGIKIDYSW